MKNQIVILGGMGPQASLKLHETILTISRKYHDGAPESYPAILHASMPIPDFISSKERFQEALDMLRITCKNLPLDSAGAVGIACNTAHLMRQQLPLRTSNFVSMIDAVVNEAISRRVRQVGILASPQTLKSGLYDTPFSESSISLIKPTKSDVNKLNEIIHQVIGGVEPDFFREDLDRIASRLIKSGAECILLGCTELPLIGLDKSIPTIDSIEVLAQAMVEKVMT